MKSSYAHLVFLFTCFLISCVSCSAMIQCIKEEREALLQFKQGIHCDACGLLTSWDGESDCCQWRGIRCDNRTNHVISLDLFGGYFNRVEGKISPSLLGLKHLKYLDLSFNFQGSPQTLPSFIGSLHSLKYLRLFATGFQGEIPHQLANLSSLTSLVLGGEYGLHATSMRWLSHLTSLRDIQMSDVNLSLAIDWMPAVNSLPFLSSLEMDGCSLSPSIPSSLVYRNSSTTLRVLSLRSNCFDNGGIFQRLVNFSSNVEHLDLSHNEIIGPIPSAVGSMQSLSHLYLSFNRFEGPFPESMSNLKSLAYLDLHANNFQGSRWNPEILANLCSLQDLDLSENNITAELSTVIRTLSQSCVQKSLGSLQMSYNSLWGCIPDEIGTFSSLRTLYLDSNQLNGAISQNLGQLSELDRLSLANNFLEGVLSNPHFLNLSRLSYLSLSNNPKLVVNISANWIPPFQLGYIDLSSCKLGPYFPKWLLTQMNFDVLDISNTGISDIMPLSFWNSLPSNFARMNISNNGFRGIIPDTSVVFDQVLEVDLSSNFFTGAVPSFLGNALEMRMNNNTFSEVASFLCPKTKVVLFLLDISNNALSGELPNCWGYFVQLGFLQLDNNNLSGNLPDSIFMLPELRALHVRNNSLSGELPLSLKNCTSLVTLDLSYNYLTGQLPHWIGNPFNGTLVILNLQSNHFIGSLPSSLCQLSKLRILDLSSNHFVGYIPKCISNLTAMVQSLYFTRRCPTVDISSDVGSIPLNPDSEWLMWKRKEWRFNRCLGLVKAIDMSNNELEGPIPDELSDLTGLVFLNLSRNRLNESITPKIGQLTSLQFLDLSSNQLCGEIPTSLSKLSSLEILDLSNNNLSGRIPLGTQLQGFDPSSYMGNKGLCGDPLPIKCPGDQLPADKPKETNKTHEDANERGDDIFLGLYISVVLGFIVGFWGVCGTLVIKRSWRHAYFRFLGDIKDRIYVMLAVSIARAPRNT